MDELLRFSSLTFSLSLPSMNFDLLLHYSFSAARMDFTNMLRRVAQGNLTLTPSQNRTGPISYPALFMERPFCAHFQWANKAALALRSLLSIVLPSAYVVSVSCISSSPTLQCTVCHFKERIEFDS